MLIWSKSDKSVLLVRQQGGQNEAKLEVKYTYSDDLGCTETILPNHAAKFKCPYLVSMRYIPDFTYSHHFTEGVIYTVVISYYLV